MTETGYCTVEDVRRALRDADLPGDASQDRDIALDAITGQTEWLHETTNRHWFEPNGISEDTDGIIPTSAKTHAEDEQDLPTRAFLTTQEDRFDNDDNTILFSDSPSESSTQKPDYGEMDGLSPQQFAGPFTRVTLFRRDVQSVSELLVLTSTGYEDWVASSDYTEGRTGDYYLHVDDSNGLTRLYLNTESLDPDLTNYSSAVVPTYDWGIEGLSNTVRRAVALRAAAQLLLDDAAAIGIPESASFVAAESKVQAMERQAEELLEVHQ